MTMYFLSFFFFKTSHTTLHNSSVFIYPTPPPQARCDTRSIFQQNIEGLNLEFSFFLPHQTEEAQSILLFNYRAWAGTDGVMPFQRTLM